MNMVPVCICKGTDTKVIPFSAFPPLNIHYFNVNNLDIAKNNPGDMFMLLTKVLHDNQSFKLSDKVEVTTGERT